MKSHSEPEQPAAGAEAPATVDFSLYRVLVAGGISPSLKHWAGLTELGVRVSVLGTAAPAVRRTIAGLPLEECLFVETLAELEAQAYARWSATDLVVLVGEHADALERLLLPWMEEAAASSLNPLLPLVRVDDRSLRFLRTGEQWAFFLLGRTLGLGPRRAREFMEECCGYPNQNR